MSSNLPDKTQKVLDSLKDKSLAQKTSDLKSKIANLRKNSNAVLLCDVSGSMDTIVGDYRENLRAYQVLNDVLTNFAGAKIYEFSDYVHLTTGQLSKPGGNTNLGRALAYVKTMLHKEIILLTDGHPDSEDDALRNAAGLKINIIYIGPKPVPKFLEKLANLTNGNFVDIELIKLGSAAGKEIENKIKGFLGSGL